MAKDIAVKQESTALATASSFEEFAGLGTENIRAEDQTIPRLAILESLSPELNKRDGKYIQGAEAGMILDKLTGEVFDGDKGIVVVPCYVRSYLAEWRPKSLGGGFVGEYPPEHSIRNTVHRDDKGADILPNGNELVPSVDFYVIVLHPEEGPQQRLLTFTKTKLKKAKKWNTLIKSQTGRTADGRMYSMPIMSTKYLLRTVAESNDKGNWNNWEVSKIGPLDRSNTDEEFLLQMGVAFAKAVGAGEVKVNREDEPSSGLGRDDVPF